MTLITAEQLTQCEASIASATPGPWTVEREGGPGVLVCDDVGDSVCRVSGNEADADFMATARTAMPMLLARIRELEEDHKAIEVIARDLTEALDGVLGTESDEPGFDEKWDRAEVSCRLAQQVFGMTKKEGTEA